MNTLPIQIEHSWTLQGSWSRPTWSPCGKLLAASGMRGIQILDAASGAKVADLDAATSSRVCWMPDGEHVIVVTYSGVQLRRVGGDVVRTWRRPGMRVEDVAVSADGQLVVLANRSEVEVRALNDDSAAVSFATLYRSEAVDLSADGRLLVGSGPYGLGLWSLERLTEPTNAPSGCLLGEADGLRATWAPDGIRMLAKANGSRPPWSFGVWTASTAEPVESPDAGTGRNPSLAVKKFATDVYVRDVAWLSNDLAALATDEGLEIWRCRAGGAPAQLEGRIPLKAGWIATNPAAGRVAVCEHSAMVVGRFSADPSATRTVGSPWSGARLVQRLQDRVSAARRHRAKGMRDHLTSKHGQPPPDDLFEAQMAFNEARDTSGFQWTKVQGAVMDGQLARVELCPGLCVLRERESRTTERTDKNLVVAPRKPCWVLVLHTRVSGGMQRSADGSPLTFELTNRRSSEDRVPGADESSDIYVAVADGQTRECWHIAFHAAKDGFHSS